MGKPDFFIIGAQKAGTTSLYRYLGQHPEIFFPAIKEPRFYALDGRRPRFKGPYPRRGPLTHTRTAYERLYRACPPNRKAGDGSTWYMYVKGTPEKIYAELPSAKLIALLRQPADRAYSNYLDCRAHRIEPVDSFREAINLEDRRFRAGYGHPWHYKEKGFYHRHLSRWNDSFPAKNLAVFLSDDLDRNPDGTVRRIFEFLGVDPSFCPDTSGRYKTHASNGEGPVRAPATIRDELTDLFLEDIEALESTFGFDLSAWKRR